jgi:hypothetical protein
MSLVFKNGMFLKEDFGERICSEIAFFGISSFANPPLKREQTREIKT